MPAAVSMLRLAGYRPIAQSTRASTLRKRFFSTPACFPKRNQRLFSSFRKTPKPLPSSDHKQNLLIVLPILCLLTLAYKHLDLGFGTPLALDTLDPISIEISARYPSFPMPSSIEEANIRLRLEEASQILGHPLDVLRYESVRVASNLGCEDEYTSATKSSPENQRLQWVMWGIFDGHA